MLPKGLPSTGTEYAALAGCLSSIMIGLIITVAIIYIKPDDFEWEITRAINAVPTVQGIVEDVPDSPRSSPGGEKPSRTAPTSITSTPSPQYPFQVRKKTPHPRCTIPSRSLTSTLSCWPLS